jgi:PAS domain S-box-containing protein
MASIRGNLMNPIAVQSKSEALRTDESTELDNIVREVSDPVFIFDTFGKIRNMNQPACELAGATTEQLADKTYDDLFSVVDGQGSQLSLDEVAHFFPSEIHGHIRHRDGTKSQVVIKPSPIADNSANPFLLCIVRPVSRPDFRRQQRILAQITSEIISVKPIPDVLNSVTSLMVGIAQVDHATITLIDGWCIIMKSAFCTGRVSRLYPAGASLPFR